MIVVFTAASALLFFATYKQSKNYVAKFFMYILTMTTGLILVAALFLYISSGGQYGQGSAFLGDKRESYKLEEITEGRYVLLQGGDATVVIKNDEGLPRTEKFFGPTIIQDASRAGTVEVVEASKLAPYLFVPWSTFHQKHAILYIEGSDVTFSG